MASIKVAYASASALTKTNLDGLATSSTWVAGWQSATIDNSSSLYSDYAVNASIKLAAAGLAAGEIRMYAIAEKNDSAWPDTVGTSEGTLTLTSAEIRDAICVPLSFSSTTTTASRVYELACASVTAAFGFVPRKFAIFITHSTGANLETSGDPNNVYVTGRYLTVA